MLAPSLKAAVDSLASRSPWFITIPPPLQPVYQSRKRAHFARLARYGSPLLVLLYIAINILTWLLYRNDITGTDLRLWMAGDSIIGALILAGVTLAQFRRWQAAYTRWVPVLLSLILMTKIVCALGIQHAAVAHNDIYIALVIVAIGSLTLGLPTRYSLGASLIAMISFPLAALFIGSTPYFLEFLGYYIGVMLIFSAISSLTEHQDHINFLQSILLEHESCEVQRLNEELAALARRDGLTGLANRRAFDESLRMEWDRAHREHTPLALLMLDVDHFKRYNDTYGHPAGDSCLTRIGAVLASVVRRPGDLAARYGGEEFALLLPGTDLNGAEEVAQRLLQQIDALALPHSTSVTAAHVTISIGIAAGTPQEDVSEQTLVDTADAALYQAKHEGRHRHAASPLDNSAGHSTEDILPGRMH